HVRGRCARHLAEQLDPLDHAVDGRQPQLYRAAEVGIGQSRPALADPTVHPCALALESGAVEPLDLCRDIRQAPASPEAVELERGGVANSRLRGRGPGRAEDEAE